MPPTNPWTLLVRLTTVEVLVRAAEPPGHACPGCRTVRPWSSYRPIGVQRLPGQPDLELAICPACSSTTARELPAHIDTDGEERPSSPPPSRPQMRRAA